MKKFKIKELLPRIAHWFKERIRKIKSKRFYARHNLEYIDFDIPFEERHYFEEYQKK